METNNKQDSWCVYIHTNTKNNKKYVGITSQKPNRRWKNGNGYSYNPYFYNAITKDGWDAFQHEIVLSDLNEFDAKAKEKELIELYKTMDRDFGYNLTSGGDGTPGLEMSEATKKKISDAHVGMMASDETKKRISDSLIGNKRAKGMHHSEESRQKISDSLIGNQRAKGNVLSDETRRKMSESHKGRVVSAETREKLSEVNKGHKVSEETRRKISEANRGRSHKGHVYSDDSKRKMSESRKKYFADNPDAAEKIAKRLKIPVDMLTTDGVYVRTFDSAKDATKELGIDNSSIIKVCKGKASTAGGYKWRYSNIN